MNYIIPEQLLIALLKYLETRPYKEVAIAINALSQLEELKNEVPTGQN